MKNGEEDEERQENNGRRPFTLREDEDESLANETATSGRLGIRNSNISETIEILSSIGYGVNQINEFVSDIEVNFEEFNGLPLDRKISKITSVLSTSETVGVNPSDSTLTAEQIQDLAKYEQKEKSTGIVNLLSKEFAWSNNLQEITPLTSRINENLSRTTSTTTTTLAKEEEEDNENKYSTAPGEKGDPYRIVLFGSDSDDDDDVNLANVEQGDFISNSAREEYLKNYDNLLNEFVAETPIQLETSMALNHFLTETIKSDPREINRNKKVKARERKLKQSIDRQYNPNQSVVKDIVSYENVESSAKFGSDLNFYREQRGDMDNLEENLIDTLDAEGKLSSEKTIEKAIDKIKESDNSTAGGIFGQNSGSNSFANNFKQEDYFKIVGVENNEQFQNFFNHNRDENLTNNSQSKLTFLPNEIRPSFSFPPLSILPTDQEQKLIGIQPMFGGNIGDSSELKEETRATITTMEIDDKLLHTSELNAIANTTASDVNVIAEEQKMQNYTTKMRQLQNAKDKATYIVQLLLKDAIRVGRIDQSMLANENVIMICQILAHVIEILLNKQSSYFQKFNNQLDLINVDTIDDRNQPYMMLIYNGNSTNLSLFDVSRNLFNFKMMEITEQQYLTNTNNDSLSIFKQFLYHVMKEKSNVQHRRFDSVSKRKAFPTVYDIELSKSRSSN